MLLQKIKDKKGFTETEKNMAEYILSHGEDIVHMTIREFSDDSFSSPTAAMRFFKKLGCEGFKDFKVKYIKELQASPHDDLLDVNRPFYIGYSTSKIAKTILSLNNQALTEIYDNLDIHAMEKAAKLVTNANAVFLYGHGDSSIRARTFINKLFKINKLCILATDSNEEAGISNNATQKDVAVFISYRGGSSRFFECAKILRERKCPMIVLSSDFKTELTENCDVWLKIEDKEKSADNIATFYSQACFDYLLNVMYSLVYASSYTKSHNHKLQIDQYTAKR